MKITFKLFIYSLILLNGSFIMLGEGLRNYQNIVSIFIVIIIVIYKIFNEKKIVLSYNKNFFWLISLYLLSVIISSIINNNYRMLLHGLQIFLLIVTISLMLVSVARRNEIKHIIFALLLSHLPLVFLPLLNLNITIPYSGLFYNPNSLGTISVTLFIVLAYSTYEQIIRYSSNNIQIKNSPKFIFSVTGSILLMVLVLLSESRTSLLSLIFILIVLFILITRKIRLVRMIKAFIPSFIVLFIIFLSAPFIRNIFYRAYLKNLYRIDQSQGISAGRFDVWIQTINEANIFGNGNSYFVENHTIAAHNTFIDILGIYGWFTLFFYVLIIIFFVVKAYKFSLSNKNRIYTHLPLLIVINFVLLSFGEVMSLKMPMFLMFILMGVVFSNQDRKVVIK